MEIKKYLMETAYIYDLDGVLVKTQGEFHAIAEMQVLNSHGIIVDPEDISARFAGVHTLEVFRQLAPGINPEQLLKEKWLTMYNMTKSKEIEQIEYAKEVIAEMYSEGYLLAVASASPLQWIELCLRKIGVEKYFSAIASSDEVAYGKPAPDVFLLAAKRLRIEPENCIAIDDGRAGVRAGLSAKMKTFWLHSNNKEVIETAITIKKLSELRPFGK